MTELNQFCEWLVGEKIIDAQDIDSLIAEFREVNPGIVADKNVVEHDHHFVAMRLRRVANLVGYKMPEGDDAFVFGVAGTILGDIARKIEAAKIQEPIAILCREIGEDTWFDHTPLRPDSRSYEFRRNSAEWDTCKVYTTPQLTQKELVADWAHASNEWADTATNGLQWLLNVKDGISDIDAAILSIKADIKHCQDLTPSLLVSPQQTDQLRFTSACEIAGPKHPEYVRGYEAAIDGVCKSYSSVLRCVATGNPCGTDTVMKGNECPAGGKCRNNLQSPGESE